MDASPENLSDCPVTIDTQVSGFAPDSLALLDQSLEFTWYEGRETYNPYPHTTGWRTLPFSVVSCLLEHEGVTQMAGRPPEVIGPGDVHLIPTGLPHKSDVLGQEGAHACWIHFTFRLLGGLDLFSLLEAPLKITDPAQAADARAVVTAVNESYALPGDQPLACLARRRVAVSRLLGWLLEVCPAKPHLPTLLDNSQRLRAAWEHLHAHYADPLDRDALVALTGLSRSRFHTLFHQLTGMGPMQYVKQRRIQAAQVLLLTTTLPIQTVATTVGYPDAFHFTRLFTAVVGCCPRTFRQRYTRAAGAEA
jgi:AraC-like DNA-binding protein